MSRWVVDGSGVDQPLISFVKLPESIHYLHSKPSRPGCHHFHNRQYRAAQRCPLLSSELLPSGTTNTTAVSSVPGERDLPAFPLFGLFNAAMGVATIIPEMDPTRPGACKPREHHHPHPGLGGHSVVRLTGLMGNGWEVL